MSFKFLSKLFSGGSGVDNPQYTMGMHKSKHYSRSEPGQTSQSKPTFGQARAEQMQQRLDNAIRERQRLARAQGAVQDPGVQKHVDTRSQLVQNRIERMQNAVNDDSNSR